MAKLRVGVIGIGVIATTKHIPNLAKRKDVEIVALCDIDAAKAEKANKDFGLNAKIYTDWKEVCANPDIDIIEVCTPNPLHYPITMAALEGGKHVHCEKPLAVHYSECLEMIAKAKEVGKKLTSGLQWRYNPATMKLKEMVKDGVFGDIFYVKSQQMRPRLLPAYGAYTSKEKNGGGVLLDAGPHSIDLPMWLLDNYDVASVRGVHWDKMKNFPAANELGPWDPEHFDVEDTAVALLTLKNGIAIYIEVSWASNLDQSAPGVVAEICGNKGGADMKGPGFENYVRLTHVVDDKLVHDEIKCEPDKIDMYAYDINHWIDAIQNNTDPAVLPEQAAVVTRVIEGIYKSAETGETVYFD